MSTIRAYRVNGRDIMDSTEFYFKIAKEDELLLCNFAVADEGIYYYKARSRILTLKENARTRDSTDGFISMEDLKDLFEMLRKVKLITSEKGTNLKITKQGRKVIIEKAPAELDE